MHAILTLHEKIRTGEITRRPGQSPGGAGIHVDVQHPGLGTTIRIGTPK
jgi:hypothetical protein